MNVELDEAVQISFSPDSKAFVTTLKLDNEIQVWKISKKPTDPHKMTAVPYHKYETNCKATTFVGFAVSSTGRYMATFSEDSHLKLWSLKGTPFHTLDTRQGVGAGLEMSHNGNLVAVYGFTSEVRVFEVEFNRNGDFVDMKRAFELGGHHKSMVSCAFDRDTKK